MLLVAIEGPLSTLIGAAAAAAGFMDIRLVLVATVVGNVGGDVVWYLVGRMGWNDHLLRYGGWLGLRPHHLARLERAMQAHAVKLILLSKVAYGLIVPTLVAAGMARVPWRRWFPVVFVTETAWSFLLVWVGFHATWMIAEFERGLHVVGLVVLAAVILGVMLLMRRRVREQSKELDPLRRVLLLEEDPLPPLNGVVKLNGEPGRAIVPPPVVVQPEQSEPSHVEQAPEQAAELKVEPVEQVDEPERPTVP